MVMKPHVLRHHSNQDLAQSLPFRHGAAGILLPNKVNIWEDPGGPGRVHRIMDDVGARAGSSPVAPGQT